MISRMMILMILSSVAMIILLDPIFTMHSLYREQIKNIYDTNNYVRLINVYNKYKKNNLYPCTQNFKTFEAIQGKVHSKFISQEVVIIVESIMSITLDDYTKVMTPGIIKCSVGKDKELDFYVLLYASSMKDLENGKGVEYCPVYERGRRYNRPAAAVSEILKTDLLKEAFQGSNYDKNKEMCKHLEKQSSISLSLICKQRISKHVSREAVVKNGSINIGDLTLLLAGKEQVDIPCVLVCKYDTVKTKRKYMNFVINDISDHTNPVKYLSRDMDKSGKIFHPVVNTNTTFNDKWAYSYEEYKQEGNSSTGPNLLK